MHVLTWSRDAGIKIEIRCCAKKELLLHVCVPALLYIVVSMTRSFILFTLCRGYRLFQSATVNEMTNLVVLLILFAIAGLSSSRTG